MDIYYIGIGAAFFAAAWAFVEGLSRLQGGKQP